MATNKNATIRYQVLDKCFKNSLKKFDINALVNACNEALYNYNGALTGVKKRQIYEDIKFMRSEQGYKIDLQVTKVGKVAYYQYKDLNFSINHQPINNQEALQLKEALLTLQRIKGLPQFEWIEETIIKLEDKFEVSSQSRVVIGFETNPYVKGLEYLNVLYQHIIHQQVIVVYYQKFENEQAEPIKMHPQYLKQYQNRWFVLGTNSKYQPITTLSLDRIQEISVLEETYEVSTIDFVEYYEDIIGITSGIKGDVTKITLHANKNLTPYILTKPLHGSQKNKLIADNGLLFTIEVVPNFELEQQILSYGEALQVIAPEFFVQKIKNRLQQSYQQYLEL